MMMYGGEQQLSWFQESIYKLLRKNM